MAAALCFPSSATTVFNGRRVATIIAMVIVIFALCFPSTAFTVFDGNKVTTTKPTGKHLFVVSFQGVVGFFFVRFALLLLLIGLHIHS